MSGDDGDLVLVPRALLARLAEEWETRHVAYGHRCPEPEDGDVGTLYTWCRHCGAPPSAGHHAWCPVPAAKRLLVDEGATG